MMRPALSACLLSLALLGCQPAAPPAPEAAAPARIAVAPEERTALDEYVGKPDPAFSWKLHSQFEGDGYTGFVLEMTSQSWRSAEEVDRPAWTHWVTIIRPTVVEHDTGLLFIGGGDNGDPAPDKASDRSARIAVETKSVVVDLGMVPNQPLRFADSPDVDRYEDDLIAYSRVKHFSTKDDEWLVRLAMVKSGVKAMDAAQAFLASEAGGGRAPHSFVVAGGSKRGWTSWLVGAVDERVTAIMPLVIDALNSEMITRHHYEVLGFFAPSLGDYVAHGLFPHKIGTPEYQAVLAIEDPYNYRNRKRMQIPKFLINASGDQFFLPDNSQFYYGDLPEPKRLRYVENSAHNLAETDAVDSMMAFYHAVLTGAELPEYGWSKEQDGSLRVTTKTKPISATLWQAVNPEARDFRVEAVGKIYAPTPIEPQADGSYLVRPEAPEKGFRAAFVELAYDLGGPSLMKVTTEIVITPDTLPFRWENAAAQYASTRKD